MIRCENEECEELIPGEQHDPLCRYSDDDDEWEPGEWYIDGEIYACPACGAKHSCEVEDGVAWLTLVREKEGSDAQ